MFRFFGKSLMLMLLGAMVMAMVLPARTAVRAQDGLSDEEKAILDRLEGAIDTLDSYTSYTSTSVELESQAINLSMAGFEFAITETTNREINGTYVSVDGADNVYGEGVVTYQQSNSADNTSTAYTVQAEVRLVDGELYVMVDVLDSEGGDPGFPEGWVVVDDMNIAQYSALGIDSLLEDANSEMDTSTAVLGDVEMFDDREALENAIESVTIDPIELEDGTAVDLITITISADGFMDLAGDTLDLDLGDSGAGMEEMVNAMLDGITFTIQVGLDADDNVRQTNTTLSINVENMDASFIPQVPEGMDASLSITMERVETTTYSDINADLAPVEAPE